MTGGGDAPLPPPPPPAVDSGEFLLQLLRNPPHQPPPSRHPQLPVPTQTLSDDPAVAAVGPTLSHFPLFPPSNSNQAHDHGFPYRPPTPPFAPHNFFAQEGFPQNPEPNPCPNSNPNWTAPPLQLRSQVGYTMHGNQNASADHMRKSGFYGNNSKPNLAPHQQEQSFLFGSMPFNIRESALNGKANGISASGSKIEDFISNDVSLPNRVLNGFEGEVQNSLDLNRNTGVNSKNIGMNVYESHEKQRRGKGVAGIGGGWGRQEQNGNYRSLAPSPQVRRPPPGFLTKPHYNNYNNWESKNRSKGFENNVDGGISNFGELNHRDLNSKDEETERRFFPKHGEVYGGMLADRGLSSQMDRPGPPAGSNLHPASASDIEESLLDFHGAFDDREESGHGMQDNARRDGGQSLSDFDELEEQLSDVVLEDVLDDKADKKQRRKRDKDYRCDKRGQWILGQRMRIMKRQIECRFDIDRLNAPFLAVYELLIPAEEEKAKQKQLLLLLEKLVSKEWPEARLYLYGSCANSFGFSKSDIDVCLTIVDPDVNKSKMLLKLADILQSDNLQNVQALTRARVPIVKLTDPVTEISCDICINNVLAVINTKLLRDYAKIDVRLRQLAFIVKHWAKSRGVNETYQGTLSSYAYVLMCIHFLQQRRPSILPCLQGMERTYSVTVDNIECAYFDEVDRLSGFGSRNGESIAQLVWAFFNYWAYRHDYATDVISVRTGSILSKQAKDWTRRIGNDRHLICIEDPFEVSHDLGRVVDRKSIRVLREEFERAAEIMQYDPDPCVTLFQPYVPS